jgi:hypothetical protein
MKRFLIAALLCGTANVYPSWTVNATEFVYTRPTFLEAAVFVLTGREFREQKNADSLSYIETQEAEYVQGIRGEDWPCLVFEFNKLQSDARHPFNVNSFNFKFLPGPRSPHIFLRSGQVVFQVHAEQRAVADTDPTTFALCHSDRSLVNGRLEHVNGSTRCADEFTWTLWSGERGLFALQYIRDNFCAGLPQPPAPPDYINPC